MELFDKTIIPLALVGYEVIIDSSALSVSLATTIPHSTRIRGITVNYFMALKSIKLMLNLKFFLQRKVNKNKSTCKRVDAGFDKYPVKNHFLLTSKSAN